METAHTQSSGQAATVEGSGSLRRQLFGTIGTMLLLLVAASLAGIVFLVGRTEQQGWQGRQREATQRVAQTVGNFIARPAVWKSGKALGDLAGKPVRVRFVMKDSRLYSMRFGRTGE